MKKRNMMMASLLGSSSAACVLLPASSLLFVAPAYAQSQPAADTPSLQTEQLVGVDEPADMGEEIVVTGSLFRRTGVVAISCIIRSIAASMSVAKEDARPTAIAAAIPARPRLPASMIVPNALPRS